MMSIQWVIGVPAAGVVFAGVLKVLGSAIDPQSGIEVHSLTFTNDPAPAIVQDRTVHAANSLTAKWTTEVTVGGKVIDACSGKGWWDYPAGRKTPIIRIDEWTGRPGCWDALPEGKTIQACAKYIWGDGDFASQCTLGFRKTNG